MLQFQPIHLSELKQRNFNTNNHAQYAPFHQKEGKTIIDEEWFQKQTNFTQFHIVNALSPDSYAIEKINIPHSGRGEASDLGTLCVPSECKEPEILNLYHTYVNTYQVHHWCKRIDSPHLLIEIKGYDLHLLKNLGNICSYREKKINQNDLEEFSEDLCTTITSYIKKCNGKVFSKLNDKSSKHHLKPLPKTSFKEIIEDIVQHKDTVDNLRRHPKIYLYLTPWYEGIKEDNEYRVIIIDKKIKAISQQHCYLDVGLTEEKVRSDVTKIINLVQGLKNKLIYNSCVLDVWVDEQAHLIEINPGELWASSGSALFHWIDDYDLLYNEHEQIYIRFVTT